MENIFYEEIKNELVSKILPTLEKNARDENTNSFFEKINTLSDSEEQSLRTVSTPAAYLLLFSESARLFKNEQYLEIAEYAFVCLMHNFLDKFNGGMYFSTTEDSTPINKEKNISVHGVIIAAFAEYASAVFELKKQTLQSYAIIDKSLAFYSLIERYAKNTERNLYVAQCDEEWKQKNNTIANCKTHLSILNGYTNLYRCLSVVYPEQKDTKVLIGKSIEKIINAIIDNFLCDDGYFSNTLEKKHDEQTNISFSETNILAGKILWEAENEIFDKELIDKVRNISIRAIMKSYEDSVNASSSTFDSILQNEKTKNNENEAILAFFTAWELTGKNYFKTSFCEIIKNKTLKNTLYEGLADIEILKRAYYALNIL